MTNILYHYLVTGCKSRYNVLQIACHPVTSQEIQRDGSNLEQCDLLRLCAWKIMDQLSYVFDLAAIGFHVFEPLKKQMAT